MVCICYMCGVTVDQLTQFKVCYISCIFLYILVYCVVADSESAVNMGWKWVNLSLCGLLLILVYYCILCFSSQWVSSKHGTEWSGPVTVRLAAHSCIFLYILVHSCILCFSGQSVSSKHGTEWNGTVFLCGLLLIFVYSCIFLYILVYYVSVGSQSAVSMERNGMEQCSCHCVACCSLFTFMLPLW